MHEIIGFHGCVLSAGEADGARVVDHNVQPAEGFHSLLDGLLDLRLISMIKILIVWISSLKECIRLVMHRQLRLFFAS